MADDVTVTVAQIEAEILRRILELGGGGKGKNAKLPKTTAARQLRETRRDELRLLAKWIADSR